MSAVIPQLPESAPFTPEQRAWLNGFFAGIFNRQAHSPAGSSPAAPALVPLTILYATQTGTAEGLAKKAAKEAGKRGFAPAVLDLGQTDPARLAAEKNVLLITSTYGDGEPPDSAKPLHAALRQGAHALAGLRYSVCALGDSNYTLFCQAGKDFDAALEKHGATRVHPRADCDVDYDAPFETWLHAALAAFGPTQAPVVVGHSSLPPEPPAAPAYSKSHPYAAPVVSVRPLNAPGSAKEVNHVEFDLSAAGPSLSYEAGDALGVIPQNDPALVSAVLAALGCDGEEAVPGPAGELPLRRALTEHYDLGKPSPALLEALGLGSSPDAGAPAAPPATLDVLDALLASPSPKPAAARLVGLLRKLQPRLYSISSSPLARPGHVHLTVGAVRYEHAGRARKGVCSTFLAERALVQGSAQVFVHSNKAFRPPADPAAPMIMVGPGTGIAPFRAFLQQREAVRAPGKNWLFFGDQKASTDFLYREELEALKSSGVLTRLDLAFSRDQAEKIYVQHRMLENAAELYAWLEQGASFYVCGDASRMAKDVDAALHRVIESAGGKSPVAAAAYVQDLRSAKRYQRDVY